MTAEPLPFSRLRRPAAPEMSLMPDVVYLRRVAQEAEAATRALAQACRAPDQSAILHAHKAATAAMETYMQALRPVTVLAVLERLEAAEEAQRD